MRDKELQEFRDYAKDHILHFNCLPVEFESSLGNVYGDQECWDAAIKLNLTYLLKTP